MLPDTSLAEIGESNFLSLLQQRLARRQQTPAVRLGVGDDAALLRPKASHDSVVCSDMLVENIDFQRRWASFADIGAKAAAINLSDLAAMGAQPQALLANVALSRHEKVQHVLTLLLSLDALGRRYGAPLVGGDLSATRGPLVVSVTAMGAVRAAAALRRGGAALHDVVLVSGWLGEAAAGLACCQTPRATPPAQAARWVRAQTRPTPQVRLGQALAAWGKVSACLDVSDGLAQDAAKLVGQALQVELDVTSLPCSAALHAWAGPRRARHWALHGGEDFQLVFSVAPQHLEAVLELGRYLKVRLSVVGRVIRATSKQPPAAKRRAMGYDHFRH